MDRISICKILKGVPFTSSNNITIDFSDIFTQQQYFATKEVASFENLSFIKGWYGKAIKLPINIEKIRDCNYLMWGNPGYENGNRWRYCYINGFKYVNDNNTIVNFTIDNYQTYMFNFNFLPTFVEREHTLNDMELNIEEENIKCNIGDFVPYEMFELDGYEEWEVGILYVPNSNRIKEISRAVSAQPYTMRVEGSDSHGATVHSTGVLQVYDNQVSKETYKYATEDFTASGSMYNNYYTGAKLEEVENNASAINSKITDLIKKGNNIVNIYMIPKKFKTETSSQNSISASLQPDIMHPLKNNKCKQYPYMFMRVNNQNGGQYDIHFELVGGLGYNLTDNKCDIAYIVLYNKLNIAEAKLIFKNYPHGQKTGGSGMTNLTEGLYLANMPLCAWENNSYANWIGNARPDQQKQAEKFISAYNSAREDLYKDYGTIGNYLMYGQDTPKRNDNDIAETIALPMISNTAKKIADTFLDSGISTAQQAYYKMSSLNGTGGGTTASLININNNLIGFIGVCYVCSNLEEIDKFFTRYGYATNKVKIPNLKGRANVNYVKTQNACIVGELPTDAKQDIENLFNTGLSIFHSEQALLNYNDDNPISA